MLRSRTARANDAGGMLPSLTAPGGVRLMVQDSDAAAGALLTDQLSPGEPPAPGEFESSPPAPASPRGNLAPGQFLLGTEPILFGRTTLITAFYPIRIRQAGNLLA